MLSLKQNVINSVSRLADDVGLDDIMYQVYLFGKIKKGEESFEMGNVLTTEELKNKVKTW